MPLDANATAVISSSVVSVEQLFATRYFCPASVQREYKWDQPNCATLLSDLRRIVQAANETPQAAIDEERADTSGEPEKVQLFAFVEDPRPPSPNYYMGAIILQPGLDEDKRPVDAVYDGLQRLTTLTIVIAILRDLAAEGDLKRRLGALVSDGGRDRLTIRVAERAFKAEVKKAGEAGKIRRRADKRGDTEQRLRRATKFFRDTLSGWSEEQRIDFAIQLLERTLVGVTVVTDDRIARQVFVSTNLYGVSLSRVELLKGQIMDLATSEADAAAVHAAWDGLTVKLKDNLEDFFVAMDFIERRKVQGADCLTDLAAHLARTSTNGTITNWMPVCTSFADAWLQLEDMMRAAGDTALERGVWKLRLFRWPEWRPLALFLLNELSGQHLTKAKRIRYQKQISSLHTDCLRLVLAGTEPTERAIIFGNAMRQAVRGQELVALKLTEKQEARIRRALITPMTDAEPDKFHALIRWIEAELWNDNIPGHLNLAVTVEHVLPQEPEADSQWLLDFPDPDERYDLTHSLGNLACIDGARNDELKNYDYVVKRATYLKPPTYKTLAHVSAHDVWTADAIRKREAELRDVVLERLGFTAASLAPSIINTASNDDSDAA